MEARHEHAPLDEGNYVTQVPIDGILWAHILLMTFTFGILFPAGLVLGLSKHRFHVPVQITAAVLGAIGYILGHSHKGRQFAAGSIHSVFAIWVLIAFAIQIGLGVLLRLHLERFSSVSSKSSGALERLKVALGHLRKVMVRIHGILAGFLPVISWVQMGFGAITMMGFCHADHLGQCLAHGIMGSSFIAYGYVLVIMLFVGQTWLRNNNKSQEFYDSLIITLWGIVNTFTEHRWGQSWSHGDYQHTSMGIIWWCAGLVGLALSRNWSTGQATRNHIPALVLIFTGYAMSQHAQHLEISTKVHAVFGYALMGAGITRIIEISFILKDGGHDTNAPKVWQHLPSFLLVESGILFMGANEEQLQYLNDMGIDHSSYILVLSSVAFLLYLLILFLMNLLLITKADGNTKIPGGSTGGGIELQPFLENDDDHRLSEDLEELHDDI